MLSLLSVLGRSLFVFLRVSDGGSFPPPLSREEESECFRRMKAGDEKAREKLIEHNLRLVAHIVKKYYGSSTEQEDLISIGTVGLIKAIDSFDPSNGARFATYGGKCLQNEILMYFRARKKHQAEVSLGDQIDTDKDGSPITYQDVICVDDTIAEDLFRKMSYAGALRYMKEAMNQRERQILSLRYGIGGGEPLTQREVAAKLGISRSYVSRIEKAALRRLAEYLGEQPEA